MELLIFIAILCIVGIGAMHIGYDSREPADSKEQAWANLGLQPDTGEIVPEQQPSRSRRRHPAPNAPAASTASLPTSSTASLPPG